MDKKDADMIRRYGKEVYDNTLSAESKHKVYSVALMAVLGKMENEGRGYASPITWSEFASRLRSAIDEELMSRKGKVPQ